MESSRTGVGAPPAWVTEPEARGDDAQILAPLDDEQRQAVTHGSGPLLVVAGAGTGKTTVISRRIAYLIATRLAHPSEILALTFTERAAAQMEARVDLLVPYGFTDMSISTFHAFGDRLIREHALEIGLPDDLRVLSEAERVVFFRERLFRLPLRRWLPLANPTRHLKAILALIARAKDEAITPGAYLEHARRMLRAADPADPEARAEAERQLELAQVYRVYQEELEAASALDFGDQILLPLRILRERSEIREKLRRRFRFILVDEFQDTNVAQFELLRLLAGDNRNLTVVGDDDQSIYKFRGAALSNILSFSRDYPDRKLVVLKRNYRSGQRILDAAHRLISYNDPHRLEVTEGISKRLKAASSAGAARIEFRHHETARAEADALAERVGELVRAGHCQYRDIALLVRANNDAQPFLQSLAAYGVPHQFSGDQGLYNRREVQLAIAFLRAVTRRNDSLSLYALAASDAYRMPMDDLARLADGARAARRSLRWMLARVASGEALVDPELDSMLTEALSSAGQEIARRLEADLARYMELARHKSTGELLYSFLSESGVLADLMAADTLEAEQRIRNLTRLFELVTRHARVAMSDRADAFVEFQDLLVEAGDDPRAVEPDPDLDAVRVLTVHRAKGLEFPVVFVGNLVMQKFPTQRRSMGIELPAGLVEEARGGDHVAEERRLFYVAMTRARETLILTSAADHGGAAPRKVSRFVLEALDLAPTEVRTTSRSVREELSRYDPRRLPPSPTAPPTAETPGAQKLRLTATGIVDFAACPLRFRYAHVLRMPAPPHHSASYGSAVHAAVGSFLRARMHGQPRSVGEVLAVYRNAWRREGYLSPEHEERRFAEGARVVERFVTHELAHGAVPASVEKDFSITRGRVRIDGRFDRIDLAAGGGAVIIDYKTGDVEDAEQAMREARQSLQLKVYALAYAERQGAAPRAVELRFLEHGVSGRARIDDGDLELARTRIEEVARAIGEARFEAKPGAFTCGRCSFRQVCPEAARG